MTGSKCTTAGRSMQDPKTDEQLIANANQGQQTAFEALYQRYRVWVFTLALRFCGSEADAGDILQDTFLYFFNKFPGFTLRAQLKTFFYPVIKHKALDCLRRQRRHVPLENHADNLYQEFSYARLNGDRHLLDLVAELPQKQREVVLLRFADNLDLNEIALTLNIPRGTVKSRLHHALTALRQKLGTD